MNRIHFCTLVLFAGCGDAGSPGPSGAGAGARFAVVRTDYETTAIAALDARGEVLSPAVLSSGSRPPGLVAPLSGDVVLGSARRGAPHVVYVVDRLGTDVVTRLDLRDGAVLGQLRVAPGDFSTNPHDVVVVDERRAWVSRFAVNLDASAPPDERGSDVIELDPSSMTRTGRRVDLSSFAVPVQTTGDDGPVEVLAHPRPSRMVLVGETLLVGLGRLSFGFDAAAPGQIALVDLEGGAVAAVALPPASRNCGAVRPVPGAPGRVLVACIGFARPFGEEAQLRATAGVYELRVTGLEAELLRSWTPRAPPRPLAVQSVLPLDADRFLAVEHGELGSRGDRAYIVDLRSGEATELFAADDAFALGLAAFDPGSGLLVLPDASRGSAALRRFRRQPDGGFAPAGRAPFTDGPLPPRAVRRQPAGEAPDALD